MEFKDQINDLAQDVDKILAAPMAEWGTALNELLRQYILVERRIYENKNLLAENTRVKNITELQVFQDVCEARDDDGKKIYTNDKSREARKLVKLSHSAGYQDLLSSLIKTELEIKELELEAEFLRKSLSNLRALLRARE